MARIASNNPDLRTFKSALKRILLRNSIVASKYGNYVMFEELCTAIFSLRWSKNRTPLEDNPLDVVDDSDDDDPNANIGSCGIPRTGMEITILDSNQKPLKTLCRTRFAAWRTTRELPGNYPEVPENEKATPT